MYALENKLQLFSMNCFILEIIDFVLEKMGIELISNYK